MSSHMPPVPPANRSPRESDASWQKSEAQRTAVQPKPDQPPQNAREQDQEGNTFQNTHNQGGRQGR